VSIFYFDVSPLAHRTVDIDISECQQSSDIVHAVRPVGRVR
jgi:hypothetical protein